MNQAEPQQGKEQKTETHKGRQSNDAGRAEGVVVAGRQSSRATGWGTNQTGKKEDTMKGRKGGPGLADSRDGGGGWSEGADLKGGAMVIG